MTTKSSKKISTPPVFFGNEEPPLVTTKEQVDTKVEKIIKYEEKFRLSSYAYPFSIFSEINRNLAQSVRAHIDNAIVDKAKLDLFKKENKDDEFLKALKFPNLRFVLSTYGGSVHAANTICAAFEHAKACGFTVEILATGSIMSAGVPIFCCGSKGFRNTDPYTQFMIHNISSFMFGTMPELFNEIKSMEFLRDVFTGIVIKNSKITKKKMDSILSNPLDYYFGADDAITLGIADRKV